MLKRIRQFLFGSHPEPTEDFSQLRTLIDHLPDLIYFKDRESRFLVSNTAHTHLLGGKEESDVLGKSVADFFPSELANTYLNDDRRVLQSGETILNYEEWTTDQYGQKRWLLTTKLPLRDPTGQVIGLIGISHDITARKQAEDQIRNLNLELQRYNALLENLVEARTQELRRAKEQMELILENTSDAIALAQSNGDIQTFNPAFRALFDEPAHGVIERILWSVANENQIRPMAEGMLAVINERQSQRVEARVSTPDGGENDIDFAFIPIQVAEQDKSGILISARDITHFKEIERFKERFVANAVHDLSTPISGLSTRLYLLKRSPEKLAEHVQSLENQVNHLRDLLLDLRTLSQLDREQVLLHLETVNLNDIIQRVYDTYEPVAITKQQKLAWSLRPDLPAISLDVRQCERVIVNLVSNAINYTPSNKTISINTFIDQNNLVFEVVDQGIGIPPEELDQVFRRFYRGDQARAVLSSGSGLGLSIVKEIVELHGGSVSVSSTVGVGSTFTVRWRLQA
ncbi:MAG: PAS domain-containing protein [Anaerolineae bacterium]|nr:PAS domain-containing protein [Anaerolineae bacterium]